MPATQTKPQCTSSGSISGWAAWNGKRLHDTCVEPTKRDVLISYDLMPLRGLRQTEKFLASRGITIERAVVSRCDPRSRRGFCLQESGALVRESLSWSITHCGGGVWEFHDPRGHELLTFHSCCGFVRSRYEGSLTEEERWALDGLWWLRLDHTDASLPRDKRKRASLERDRQAAKTIFARLNLEIVPVQIVRA